MDKLRALIQYFAWCVVEGDWDNDWITWFPVEFQNELVEMGRAVAILFGID